MNKYTFLINQLTASLFIRSAHGTETMLFAVATDVVGYGWEFFTLLVLLHLTAAKYRTILLFGSLERLRALFGSGSVPR